MSPGVHTGTVRGVPRWGPDADDRLYRAAMELILERGYHEVTVAEIAEHAGLTKRSFFRHFADKREVLFAGAADFERAVVDAVRAAPPAVAPLDAVVAALAGAGAPIAAWGDAARRRQRLVASAPELRERELIKMDAVSTAVAGVLRERGVDGLAASLAAQVGVAAFTTAFQQWADAEEPAHLGAIMDDALAQLRAVVVDPA